MPEPVVTNLRILKPSRKKVRPGDIYALQVRNGEYLFGRVIQVSETGGPMEGYVLIYIYNVTAADKQDIPPLSRENLLVPPIMTNRLPWVRGYFETIENRPLVEEDVLPVHCFEDSTRGGYRNETGERLPRRVEPCGDWGLHSFRTIDDAISKALGIPLAPEDD